MDAVHFIKEVLSEPDLKFFLLMFDPFDQTNLGWMLHDLTNFHRFMLKTNFSVPEDEKLALIVNLRLTACKVGNFMREIGNFMSEIPDDSKNQSTILPRHYFVNTLDPIIENFTGKIEIPDTSKNLLTIFMKEIKILGASENLFAIFPRQYLENTLDPMKIENFMREILDTSKNLFTIPNHYLVDTLDPMKIEKVNDLVKKLRETLNLINGVMVSGNYLKQTKTVRKRIIINTIFQASFVNLESYILDEEGSGYYKEMIKPWIKEGSEGLLLIKAVPALDELSGEKEKSDLLLELFAELENLPKEISMACEEQPLSLFLVGSLLSLKERTYPTWNKVKDDLRKMKDSDNHDTPNIAYCYGDLPYFLKPCFLYLACYPIDYEIPAWSLTAIWVAEGFIIPEKGEAVWETANKYLEQLVERSLVLVSKRSLLGTIKRCRVPTSIHEFAIQQSCKDGFLVPNPDKEKMESLFRFAIHHAIHHDDKNQYTEVKNNYIQAILAFDFHRNVLGSPLFLRVLELINSAIPNNFENMIYLRYLGLRDTIIETLPQNIGNMRNLQTLDVRDTTIKTLPESLWNISTLCNIYVNPGPEIKGPPPTAPIPNLQILKSVVVPESWLEYNLDFPWQESNRHFLINLRKIALLIVNNLQWKHISNILNHMVNLHSMKILGNDNINIPSEYVDARAFRVLETVKSFKCVGKLNLRKLPIDNIEFPPNLIKLTLAKTGFKEDPMLFLEKLQALKFLLLQDGAYTGEKMVCSANGFQQLRFIELSNLWNLDFWEVKPLAMAQLTTMRVVQCQKLDDLPDLEHVTHIITDIYSRNPETYSSDDLPEPYSSDDLPEPDLSLPQLEPISTGLNRSVSELDPNLPLTNLPKLEPLSDSENEYLNIEEESVQVGLEDEPSFRV